MRWFIITTAAVAAAGIFAATAAADVTYSTHLDVSLCPNITQTSYPTPLTGPTNCSAPNIGSNLGTFCASGNPFGVFIATRVDTGGAPDSGALALTLTAADGTVTHFSDVVMPGAATLKTIGTLAPGGYTLRVAFLGSSRTADQVYTFLPSETTVTFTIDSCVTSQSLGQLTTTYIQSSPRYQALSPTQKALVDQLANSITATLAQILPTLTPTQKAQVVRLYQIAVQALVPFGWLTQAQATQLIALSNML
jgi:hypothetical protein